jgi:hypothetical protein
MIDNRARDFYSVLYVVDTSSFGYYGTVPVPAGTST